MRGLPRLILYGLIMSILVCTVFAAEPTGPRTLTSIKNETLNTSLYTPGVFNATAGYVSEINFNVWTVTRTWQGFFGNVSGTIVLADQSNRTLYDWSNTNPNGRVYATRTSSVPTWSSVRCANSTEMDMTEAQFSGTNETDRDGLFPIDRPNATFVKSFDYVRTDGVTSYDVRYANYSTFWVGPVTINGTFNSTGGNESTQCFSAVMDYNSTTTWENGDPMNGNDINHWREVVLSDGTNRIYTAILEKNYDGFDGAKHDFQMIVPENGHGTDTTSTAYYFYVDLE